MKTVRNNLFFPAITGFIFLVVFISWNGYRNQKTRQKKPGAFENIEREQLTDTSGYKSRRLVLYDFEWGNPDDSASHISSTGHSGTRSFYMKPWVPFSPGLWVKFKDLPESDSCWIRASGWVWFSCTPSEIKCTLVATCNHNGLNYKYMSLPLEMENLEPIQWNRVAIDYRIPPVHDKEDVLQAYFWNRGTGELLVDDFEVKFFKP
ncbi:MAG: hypothetical protein WCI71_02880 [Bacteroidota bacterium]